MLSARVDPACGVVLRHDVPPPAVIERDDGDGWVPVFRIASNRGFVVDGEVPDWRTARYRIMSPGGTRSRSVAVSE